MRHKSILPVSILFVAGCCAFCTCVLLPFVFEWNHASDRLAYSVPASAGFRYQPDPGRIRSPSPGLRSVWLDQDPASLLPVNAILANSAAARSTTALSVHPIIEYDSGSGSFMSTDGTVVALAGKNEIIDRTVSHIPEYLRLLFTDMDTLYKDAVFSLDQGFSAFLQTAGIFLCTVFSIFPLCFFSQWRLLNLMLCLAAMRGFLFLWTFAGESSWFDSLHAWSKNVFGVDIGVQVVFAGLCVLLLIVGIIRIIDLVLIHPEPVYE